MKWTTKTAFKVRLIEGMRLVGNWVRSKRGWTISMRGIIIEVALGLALQPLVLSRSNRQIIHAEIHEVSECVTVKRRQLLRFLCCGRIGRISEPVEIGGAERFVFFSRIRCSNGAEHTPALGVRKGNRLAPRFGILRWWGRFGI